MLLGKESSGGNHTKQAQMTWILVYSGSTCKRVGGVVKGGLI